MSSNEDEDFDMLTSQDFLGLQSIAKDITPEDLERDFPGDSMWIAIQSELAGGADASVGEATPARPGQVASLEHHRTRRRPSGILFGAIAAAIVVVVAVGSILSTQNDDRVISSTEIAALEGSKNIVGSAQVIERGDQLVLSLDLSDADLIAVDGEFLELWVIDENVVGMHSLGIVDGNREFVLPAGLDTTNFPIVDVSVEPIDGDPTHSGASVFRGVLS